MSIVITPKINMLNTKLVILVPSFEEKMFYPARWKKRTVDQSKVTEQQVDLLTSSV